MLPIAPLNYERYTVVVSPLLVPDAAPAKAALAARETEPVTPLSAELYRHGSAAGEQMKQANSSIKFDAVKWRRGPEHPFNAPLPIDLPRTNSLSPAVLRLMDGKTEITPWQGSKRYELPEKALHLIKAFWA